ncbi:hypothetical protein WDW86_16520 [Bdellovibrionota bacterium FG-2]
MILTRIAAAQAVVIVYCKNRFAAFAALEYTELVLSLPAAAREKVLEKIRRLRRTLTDELLDARPA